MDDPKSKKGVGGPQGVGVPAKGDSSASNAPFDPLEGATISDAPLKPAPPPPAKPTTSVKPSAPSVKPPSRVEPLGDATISDAPLTPPAKPTPSVKPPAPPVKPPSRVEPLGDATISDVPLTPPPPTRRSTPSTPRPPSQAEAHPDATLSDSLPATPASRGPVLSGIYMKEAILQPGDLIGARYEIVSLLGEGGMGAVYKALDREVERTVALKLIRPELASNPAILARFKQELLTAHQVTHRNVIRIYDIAEADGVKFITMEFVEGDDLRRILTQQGKLPVERTVEIIRQVCLALDAAHSAGIIHRDLKPQNIMQEAKTGRILVMDFGLARTIGGDGMTQTGALLGTIEYMSPEQSMGKTLDQRSDIFAVGLMFYELLVGKTPYKADTAMASLLRRNQERAVPAAELDSSVPKALSDIVSKCLERDLEHRYQSVQEILFDLDAFHGARPTLASISLPVVAPPVVARPATPWKWIGIAAIAVVVIGGGWFVVRPGLNHNNSAGAVAEAKGPELSLAILPFQNTSGDPALDQWGSNLADMLTTAVGQSAHLRIVSPDRLHQVLTDLRVTSGTAVDSSMLTNVAKFSNADTLVWGKFFKNGDKIHIEATVKDLKTGRDNPISVDAGSQNDITAPVNQLAELIRKNLTVSSDVQKELKASSFQPVSKSPAALSAYLQGLQMRRQGKNLEAVKLFQAAVQGDPEFALAYSRLAETNSALGYDSQAEQASRKAMELDAQLPLAEKYLIEANHARVMKDSNKAVETYQKLAASLPGDGDVQFALGNAYLDAGQFDKAREQYARVLKNDPRNLAALIQTGWLEVLNGKPQAGLDPLNSAQTLAVELDNEEQHAQVLQFLGIAYDEMNRYDEALRNVNQSLEINKKLGDKSAEANNYTEIGDIQANLGKSDLAYAAYNQALALRRDIGAKKDIANSLISIGGLMEDRGDYDKALSLYKESLQTQRDVGDPTLQAVCLNNIGSIYLVKGQNEDAIAYYKQALDLREKLNNPVDTADTLHNLGEAYTKTAQYDLAMASYERALQLRRAGNDSHNGALELHSMGMVFLNQGRFGAAVSNLSESVQGFQKAQDRSRLMVQVLIDYAEALAKAGRSGEVGKSLEEARTLATELKNDKLLADVHNAEGDIVFYGGETKNAKEQYQQALLIAQRAKSPETVLNSKLNLARVAIAEGRSASVVNDLRAISQDADRQGMKYLALVSSVDLAEALINSKDYARANDVLTQALNTSEKLGVRMQTALIHYQLGNLAKQKGDAAGAAADYRQATSILDEIKKEQGAEHTLDRADLKAVYAQASQGTRAKG
jgi:eukaryotic-like serine/threonine-protein kinase